MKNIVIVLMAATGILLFSGCMTGYGSISDHQKRQMTTREIVTMTTEGVSDSLIIAQIRATHSEFTLSSQDILNLKKAGVSDGVVIESQRMRCRPVYTSAENRLTFIHTCRTLRATKIKKPQTRIKNFTIVHLQPSIKNQ
jgi:hypothetical protein